MAPVRLRHPAGTSTLQVPLEDESFTVQDLQQQIHSAAGILPSRQICEQLIASRGQLLILFAPSEIRLSTKSLDIDT